MSASKPEPADHPAELEFLPADAEPGLPLGEWLKLVGGDEPVVLPRPVSEYLTEARAAGEV